MRACWIYGVMEASLVFSERDHMRIAVIGFHRCLFDKNNHEPVKLAAAITVGKLIIKNEDARMFLKPALTSIIESYLILLDTIDHEELFEALESILNVFQKEIIPFGNKIVRTLVEQYKNLLLQEKNVK
jgi:hypothetical protein